MMNTNGLAEREREPHGSELELVREVLRGNPASFEWEIYQFGAARCDRVVAQVIDLLALCRAP